MIDLGDAPREAVPPPVDPPVPLRALLGLLSIALLGLLAAAGPVPHSAAPIVIPADLGDAVYVSDDRMFVVSGSTVVGNGVRVRTIDTYELPRVLAVDSTMVTVSGAVDQVLRAGDIIVASYQLDASGRWAVVAVEAGTDETLWRRPARLLGTDDGQVLLAAEDATLAVDAATGIIRWSVVRPPGGVITETGPAGYPRWLVIQSASGLLETRDAHTGKLVAGRTLPLKSGYVWPVGDLITVDTRDGYSAYHLPDLTFRWRTEADLSQSWMQADCGTLICTFRQQTGMVALDRQTGRALWSSELWAYAEPAGPYLAATRLDRRIDEPAVWLLDPATGKPVGDFGRWESLGRTGDGMIYGKIDVRGEYVLYYGLLDPAEHAIRVTGAASGVSGNCRAASGVLICRLVDASVAVWPLR
ncbi:outer membrane protein assembly factor BamB family protein [Paractinoplanes atraurantiacus]|uniref:PQQ-like domain-containing protein n=1 Tax=Paractinoplanes atraurantiacus TaxID=1036182 RepID=A0A285IND2_9ACTN|nr:PQQ-binding-like beta-propeller repeat protein [Actinoplanes atraurantiacus]SNY49488.1 PQQ-like domain-containing protein [Actinoplanes atraurantiacus]